MESGLRNHLDLYKVKMGEEEICVLRPTFINALIRKVLCWVLWVFGFWFCVVLLEGHSNKADATTLPPSHRIVTENKPLSEPKLESMFSGR